MWKLKLNKKKIIKYSLKYQESLSIIVKYCKKYQQLSLKYLVLLLKMKIQSQH